MMSAETISRRSFLRGRPAQQHEPAIRPPWIATAHLSRCTSCGDCAEACSEDILQIDESGLPRVSFEETGCTFCGDCAAVCTHDVFSDATGPAWQATVQISSTCLLDSGVSCQVCTDFCDTEALRFDMMARPMGALQLSQDRCTGCGMCIGACPVSAISLTVEAAT